MQVVWETKGQLNSRKEYISWEFKQDQKQDPHSLSPLDISALTHTHTLEKDSWVLSKKKKEQEENKEVQEEKEERKAKGWSSKVIALCFLASLEVNS